MLHCDSLCQRSTSSPIKNKKAFQSNANCSPFQHYKLQMNKCEKVWGPCTVRSKFEHVQGRRPCVWGPLVDKMIDGQTLLKTLPSFPLAGCKYTWPCCCGHVVSVYIVQGRVPGLFGVCIRRSHRFPHSSTNTQTVKVRSH